MSWQFTVGLEADRIVVDTEDALITALKAKADQPGAREWRPLGTRDRKEYLTQHALSMSWLSASSSPPSSGSLNSMGLVS